MAGVLLWSKGFASGVLALLEPLPAGGSAVTTWLWSAGAPPVTARTGWEAGSTPEAWSWTTAGWGSTTDWPGTQQQQHSAQKKWICTFVRQPFGGAHCYPLLPWITDPKSNRIFHRTGMEKRSSKTYRTLNPSCKPKLQILKEPNKPSSVPKALQSQ